MRYTLLTAVLLATACTAPPNDQSSTEQQVAKAAAPQAGGGLIESVDSVGTGCDPSDTVTAISGDKQATTTIFSAFVATADPLDDPALRALNCLLMFQINVPAGWQYSLENAVVRGFAGLENGVTASRQSLYVISGSPVHVVPPARFKGEINDDYGQEDISPDAPGVWSPCGGGQVLWIATQTEVNNSARPSRAGQLTVDTIDTLLQWRRCQ